MAQYQGKRFAVPSKLDKEATKARIEAAEIDGLFVYYTGGVYRRRPSSGRSVALATITEKGKPLPLRTLLERAAKAGPNGTGYSPDLVRSGLFLHQGAKPAVYYVLAKGEDGAYRAVKPINATDGGTYGTGDVVVDKGGKLVPPKKATTASPAPKVEVKGGKIAPKVAARIAAAAKKGRKAEASA
jgi:hypothetical protein